MANVDVYRIARLLIEEHGIFAQDEINEKIDFFRRQGDAHAVKTWYEIDEAFKEIQNIPVTEPATEEGAAAR